jgi:hypothetical protein
MKIDLNIDIAQLMEGLTDELADEVTLAAKDALRSATLQAVTDAANRYYSSGPGRKALDAAIAKACTGKPIHV